MELVPTIVVSAITGFVAVVTTFLAARVGKKGERENNLIDQLQEERAAGREELKEQKEEFKRLSQEQRNEFTQFKAEVAEQIKEYERRDQERSNRERVLVDYVLRLRDFIYRGETPPPPEWPEGFLNDGT